MRKLTFDNTLLSRVLTLFLLFAKDIFRVLLNQEKVDFGVKSLLKILLE